MQRFFQLSLSVASLFYEFSFKCCLAVAESFHDGDRYHIETSPLICSANQWTGFYMITAFVMEELIHVTPLFF